MAARPTVAITDSDLASTEDERVLREAGLTAVRLQASTEDGLIAALSRPSRRRAHRAVGPGHRGGARRRSPVPVHQPAGHRDRHDRRRGGDRARGGGGQHPRLLRGRGGRAHAGDGAVAGPRPRAVRRRGPGRGVGGRRCLPGRRPARGHGHRRGRARPHRGTGSGPGGGAGFRGPRARPVRRRRAGRRPAHLARGPAARLPPGHAARAAHAGDPAPDPGGHDRADAPRGPARQHLPRRAGR